MFNISIILPTNKATFHEFWTHQVLLSDLFGYFIRDPFRGVLSDLHLGDHFRSRMEVSLAWMFLHEWLPKPFGVFFGPRLTTPKNWRTRRFPWKKETKTSWWFQIFFIFIPTCGDDPIWRAYFSDGLVQPPTRKTWPPKGAMIWCAAWSWGALPFLGSIFRFYVSFREGTP